jgi:predicted ATPase/DNA-binding SARP family transcriptional activator
VNGEGESADTGGKKAGAPFAFELRLFGLREALVEGAPLPRLRARAGLNLLALLALHPHPPLERSWLAATLWPDSSEEQGRYNLRRNLVDLRRVLGDQAWRLDSPTPRSLRLDLDNAFCDVHVFDTILHDNPPASEERWEAAIALYRGPLLEGCTDEWVLAEREARERGYVAVLEALSTEAMREGRFMEAAGHLRRVIAVNPYRETAQRALMEALAAAGDLASVTLAYRELRLFLLRECRSEPSPETQNLYRTLRLRTPQGRDVLRQHSDGVADACTALTPENVSPSRPAAYTPPDKASHHLPCPLTLFIGRSEERTAVRSALETARIVTLTGPGGVGKTRLALAIAEEAGSDFPDGVWFVDLAPIRDGKAAPQAVAAALGLHIEIDAAPEETLYRVLGQKRVLLILDNGEQIADACAHLAIHLLRACPQLCILCTSRQPLYVPGEKVWVVSPLRVPPAPSLTGDTAAFAAALTDYDAVVMLLDRVALTAPSFRLTTNNASAVAQLCRQLDGLPLALELVAALFRSLSVRDIVDRLDRRLRLLAGGDPTLARQQTLQAAIAWSYDLLNEAERTLLRRLSIFEGGWTLEAAEAVCAEQEEKSGEKRDTNPPASVCLSPSDVLDLLISLTDKSLVVYEEQEERGRYRLLETTREYAAQSLSLGERQTLQKRHAGFFRHMARLMETGETELQGQGWLKRLWVERDNFRAAHAWYLESDAETALWLEFYLYNTRTWPVQNAREWIARLQQQSMPPTAVGVRVAYSVASWALWLGDPASEHLLKQALEVACASGENLWQMLVLAALMSLEEERGDKRQALGYAEATLACAKASRDIAYISEYTAKVALHLWNLGEVETARQRLQTMLQEGRQSGDWHLLYYSLWGLGKIALAQGEYAEASACCQEILPLAERYLPFTQPDLWRSLGWAACMQQDYPAAWRCFDQALAISQQMHVHDREGWTRFDMAEVAFRQGDAPRAREQLCYSLSVFESIHEPRSVVQCLQKFAKFYAAWGQTTCAVVLLASAERACQEQEFTADVESQEAARELAAMLRSTLDPVEWQTAWKHGSAMTPTQATAYALSALAPSVV